MALATAGVHSVVDGPKAEIVVPKAPAELGDLCRLMVDRRLTNEVLCLKLIEPITVSNNRVIILTQSVG